ncbi:MAG: hypothetical protein ACK5LC_15270, partial [Coprobacillaceae bacterium]
MEKKQMSWKVVIALLILFWPIGIYLLFKKTSNSRKSLVQKRTFKTTKNIGIGLIIFGALSIIMVLTGSMEHSDTKEPYTIMEIVPLSIFFIAGGGYLLQYSNKMGNRAKRMQTYISIIVNQEVINIREISSIVSQSETVVREDIQYMIEHHFFDGAYINESTGDIVLKKKESLIQPETQTNIKA